MRKRKRPSIVASSVQKKIKRLFLGDRLRYADDSENAQYLRDAGAFAAWEFPATRSSLFPIPKTMAAPLVKWFDLDLSDHIDNTGRFASPSNLPPSLIQQAQSLPSTGNSKYPIITKSHGYFSKLSGGYGNDDESDGELPPWSNEEFDDPIDDSEWEQEDEEEDPILKRKAKADRKASKDFASNQSGGAFENDALDPDRVEEVLDVFDASGRVPRRRRPSPKSSSFEATVVSTSTNRGLTRPEIDMIINREIQSMIDKWRETRLPKLLPRARKFWREGQRLHSDWGRAYADLDKQKIPALIDKVASGVYTKEKELVRMCKSLEGQVENREELGWKIELCKGEEPSRPERVNKAASVTAKDVREKPVNNRSEGGAEDDDDDGSDSLNDFIVSDDDGEELRDDDEEAGATSAGSKQNSVRPQAHHNASLSNGGSGQQTPAELVEQAQNMDGEDALRLLQALVAKGQLAATTSPPPTIGTDIEGDDAVSPPPTIGMDTEGDDVVSPPPTIATNTEGDDAVLTPAETPIILDDPDVDMVGPKPEDAPDREYIVLDDSDEEMEEAVTVQEFQPVATPVNVLDASGGSPGSTVPEDVSRIEQSELFHGVPLPNLKPVPTNIQNAPTTNGSISAPPSDSTFRGISFPQLYKPGPKKFKRKRDTEAWVQYWQLLRDIRQSGHEARGLLLKKIKELQVMMESEEWRKRDEIGKVDERFIQVSDWKPETLRQQLDKCLDFRNEHNKLVYMLFNELRSFLDHTPRQLYLNEDTGPWTAANTHSELLDLPNMKGKRNFDQFCSWRFSQLAEEPPLAVREKALQCYQAIVAGYREDVEGAKALKDGGLKEVLAALGDIREVLEGRKSWQEVFPDEMDIDEEGGGTQDVTVVEELSSDEGGSNSPESPVELFPSTTQFTVIRPTGGQKVGQVLFEGEEPEPQVQSQTSVEVVGNQFKCKPCGFQWRRDYGQVFCPRCGGAGKGKGKEAVAEKEDDDWEEEEEVQSGVALRPNERVSSDSVTPLPQDSPRKRPRARSTPSSEESEVEMVGRRNLKPFERRSDNRSFTSPSDRVRNWGGAGKKKKRKFYEAKPESRSTVALRDDRKRQQKEIEERERRRQMEQPRRDWGSGKKILVNPGHADNEAPIYFPQYLASTLKPHQIEGVRFIWKNLIMMQLDREDGKGYAGCILAHAMGLGKTCQVVAFLSVLAREIKKDNPAIPEHLRLQANKVLVVVPPSLVANWQHEISLWDGGDSLRVHILPRTSDWNQRHHAVKQWHNQGGVFLIGYQILAGLCKPKLRPVDAAPGEEPVETEEAKQARMMTELLLSPGASLLICDEGQELRNTMGVKTRMLNNVNTPSRICLTGYPLQNNLVEYWGMVNFVAPGWLGDLKEYKDAYETPIVRGGFADSTLAEQSQARRQLWKLREQLSNLIDRKDNTLLTEELQPKHEYMIFCQLTPFQRELYNAYLDSFDPTSGFNGDSILSRHHAMTRLCNHPWIYQHFGSNTRKKVPGKVVEKKNSGDSTFSEWKRGSGDGVEIGMPQTPRSGDDSGEDKDVLEDEGEMDMEVEKMDDLTSSSPPLEHVFRKYEDLDNLRHSVKMKVVIDIVRHAMRLNEKVLVFSRSLETLEIILKKCGVSTVTIKGDVQASTRQGLVDKFNETPNENVFLISIKAGSVGMNLQGANRVILVDWGWNPSEDEQAIGRAYRYGQTRPVYVYRLIVEGTVEDQLRHRNAFKVALAKDVVDKKNILKLTTRESMTKYFKRPPETQEWEMTEGDEQTLSQYDDRVIREVAKDLRNSLVRIDEHKSQDVPYNPTEEEEAEWSKELEEEKANRNSNSLMKRSFLHAEAAIGSSTDGMTSTSIAIQAALSSELLNGNVATIVESSTTSRPESGGSVTDFAPSKASGEQVMLSRQSGVNGRMSIADAGLESANVRQTVKGALATQLPGRESPAAGQEVQVEGTESAIRANSAKLKKPSPRVDQSPRDRGNAETGVKRTPSTTVSGKSAGNTTPSNPATPQVPAQKAAYKPAVRQSPTFHTMSPQVIISTKTHSTLSPGPRNFGASRPATPKSASGATLGRIHIPTVPTASPVPTPILPSSRDPASLQRLASATPALHPLPVRLPTITPSRPSAAQEQGQQPMAENEGQLLEPKEERPPLPAYRASTAPASGLTHPSGLMRGSGQADDPIVLDDD
ncbi:hypothetical protein HDV00_004554 [Rhizophlyctis rosea]|nr:hypothetical protein HDV00_004554 [Rhizophlyctis rosea]